MIELIIFVFGLCVGSFLNVCIYRIPRGKSIVRPGSQCVHCRKLIDWYDNIPLVSFILLRGKCRSCGEKISSRYFLIELATGILWLFLWRNYGYSWFFVAGLILFSILLAVSVIDLETGYIPDVFTFPGMALGLLLAAIHPELLGQSVWTQGIVQSFLGLAVGAAILWLIGIIGTFMFHKESMGQGDMKLLAMIGAFIGMKKVIFVCFLAPVIAFPVILYLIVDAAVREFKKSVQEGKSMSEILKNELATDAIPYGPYLAIAGVILFVFGDSFVNLFF